MNKAASARELVQAAVGRIEAALEQRAGAFTGPDPLKAAMSYSLLAGGKRFRPLLVLASAQGADLSEEAVLPMACALEMIHTYSLIHDDLPAMDNDDLRRGRPTSHIVHGEALAILAGDALLNEATLILISAYGGTPQGAAAAAEIIRSAGKDGMIGGQVLDIAAEGRTIDLPHLEAMHGGKTGAIITSALTAPLLLAGRPQTEVDAMADFGRKLGIYFQIQDDVLDVEADAKTLGKTAGKDARDEKSTFVSILGLEASKHRLIEMEAELRQYAGNTAVHGPLLPAILEIFARRDH